MASMSGQMEADAMIIAAPAASPVVRRIAGRAIGAKA
jgi:hypothetical protein